jgi:hypothetical protein
MTSGPNHDDEYLTIGQASAVFAVQPATVRRLLRAYGLGDFVRASMRRDVLIRRSDIERALKALPPQGKSGAA